jgi:CxxC motif-containing protein (DUF1111 family)
MEGHPQFSGQGIWPYADLLLYDGRARTVITAILWHGGEAQATRDRVVALPPADRPALLAFPDSL